MSKLGAEIQKAAAYVKEELYEHDETPEGKRKAQEARDERNAAKRELGEAPLTGKPGTGNKA